MKTVVSSVPGAGKTTALQYLKRKIRAIKIVNEGDMIYEIAKRKFKVKDRDEMRKKLSIEQQRKVQEEVARKISRMRSKIILIDTHMAVKTPSGFFPGLPDKVIKIIKPDVIFLLEYDPEDVLEQRKMDPKRNRDIETEEQIDEHQKANRELAYSAAQEIGSVVSIINLRFKEQHPFQHAEKAAEEIAKILKEMMK